MSNFFPHLLSVVEYLGLIALTLFNLRVFPRLANGVVMPTLMGGGGESSVLGLAVFPLSCSAGILALSVWSIWVGKLGLALISGVLALPVVLPAGAVGMVFCVFPLRFALMGLVRLWIWLERLLRPGRPAAQTLSLAHHGNSDKVIPQTNQPSMNPDLPPTNPTACDALVSEAEQLPPGSMANEKLIEDCLMTAFITASAKHQSQIPLETMVEPHISRQPAGSRGRMAWEEIWVFQTTPKTAVRVAFEEDGKGGAGFAIGQN